MICYDCEFFKSFGFGLKGGFCMIKVTRPRIVRATTVACKRLIKLKTK